MASCNPDSRGVPARATIGAIQVNDLGDAAGREAAYPRFARRYLYPGAMSRSPLRGYDIAARALCRELDTRETGQCSFTEADIHLSRCIYRRQMTEKRTERAFVLMGRVSGAYPRDTDFAGDCAGMFCAQPLQHAHGRSRRSA